MRRPLVLQGIRQPAAFYALNVERVLSNPQSEISGCSHIRVYYFKVEAVTLEQPRADDANTPCRISRSRDVRVYCQCGNVQRFKVRPMLKVADSEDIVVSQLKTFRPAEFPLLTETRGGVSQSVPSSRECALFVRDSEGAGRHPAGRAEKGGTG